MKILLINQNYQLRGGADRYYFETIKVLEANGHQVIPFAAGHQDDFKTEYSKYFSRISGTGKELPNMSTVKKMQLFINSIYSFEAASQLEKLIKKSNPDIAHVHNVLPHLTPSIFPVMRKYNLPTVQSLHDWHIVCGGAFLYTQDRVCERCKGGKYYNCLLYKCDRQSFFASLAAMLSKYADKLFNLWEGGVNIYAVPNKYMLDRIVDWGFSREQIYTIPNPFSLEGLTPTFQVGSYVVWYGRLTTAKGIFTLLRAAQENPDIRFELYGSSGPAEPSVREYIRLHKMSNVVLDTTLRWGDELKERIANALCVVEPSEWYNPSQYVLWESQALGKAVVASNIGGTPDLIKDDINGSLFNAGDWKVLGEKISVLKNNPGMAEKWGKEARKNIEILSDTNTYYNRLMEIYQHAVESKGNIISGHPL
jgi:glycosyltransferase involved in cell wall biosynthesis